MKQLSISDIQRNLHKLDSFDIVEIIDKKRDKVKGYFVDSKYAAMIQKLIADEIQRKTNSASVAGSLHHYANPSLMEEEGAAWKEHIKQKHAQ